MSLRNKLLTATVLGAVATLVSGAAFAYDGKWYIGGGGGWEHMPDGWAHNQFSIDDGYIADGRLGFKPTGSPFRFEADLSYRTNDASPKAGSISLGSLMGNAIYDFQMKGALHPYVGIGVGGAHVNYKLVGGSGAGAFSYKSESFRIAGQAIAGVELAVTSNLAFNVEYRFMAMNYGKFEGTLGGKAVKHGETFLNHSVLAGFTWTFGSAAPPPPPPAAAPPPPPPPPPPAEAPPVFKIFFPWNSSALTPDAKRTVDEIASQYKDKKIDHIHIEGNTDSSGGADYNMNLGSKRASVVEAELVAQGIPESVIDTLSRGETNPAVQTGDNVKEPLNRRAEVTIKLQ